MKINEVSRISALNQYEKKSYSGNANKAEKSKTDELLISPQAKALQGTHATEVTQRNDRIQPLKDAIHNGTYQIDAYELADKLLPYFTPKKGE